MKTVTLAWGNLWGTATGVFVALTYRGKLLKEFACLPSEIPKTKAQALEWAHNQGYTHYQLAQGGGHKFSIRT